MLGLAVGASGRDSVTPSLVLTLSGIVVGYALPLFEVNSVSNTLAALFRSDLTAASFAVLRWLRNTGIATAARMPITRMTTSSSMRVKPASFLSKGFDKGDVLFLSISFPL